MYEPLKIFLVLLFVCMFWIELFQTGLNWRLAAYVLIIGIALRM